MAEGGIVWDSLGSVRSGMAEGGIVWVQCEGWDWMRVFGDAFGIVSVVSFL